MSSQQTTPPSIAGEIVEAIRFADLPDRCRQLREDGYHVWRLDREDAGYTIHACHWPNGLSALHRYTVAHRNHADHGSIAGGGADGVASPCNALNAKCE